jgi:hypothetical protein
VRRDDTLTTSLKFNGNSVRNKGMQLRKLEKLVVGETALRGSKLALILVF